MPPPAPLPGNRDPKEADIFHFRSISQHRRGASALGVASLLALGGCERMDEDRMRAHLAQWFALGETLSFATQTGCSAGVFRLVDTQVNSAMPVVRSVPRAARAISQRGAMALDQPGVTPDQAMVDLANAHRSLGMQMRRAGLEGRGCMDAITQTAFSTALGDPETVLAFDQAEGVLIMLDPVRGLLVVAVGERS